MIRSFKTIPPLIWRVVVFLCLFVAISGVIGPKVISGGILFSDGFAIYGGIGKTIIFSLVAFILLVKHNKTRITLKLWQPALLGWIAASIVSFIFTWIYVENLLAGQRDIQNLIGAHTGIFLSIIFAAIGCVGPKNIQTIWLQYEREVLSSVVFGVLFYLFLLVVYMLWQPLASLVLFCVTGLLGITGLDVTILPPHTLLFDKFGITIAEFCSGIESIALFTGLYVIVGLLDWKRLHKRRFLAVFPLALVILFILNVVRVYGLIVAGYYINPAIAFSLFHTYAGIIFFILYSAIFWAIAYKYLLKQPGEKEL